MEMIEPYLNWIYLACVVLALLLFAWIMVRAFGGKVRARKGARLGISEYYEVDKSRFLVLVRRDPLEREDRHRRDQDQGDPPHRVALAGVAVHGLVDHGHEPLGEVGTQAAQGHHRICFAWAIARH